MQAHALSAALRRPRVLIWTALTLTGAASVTVAATAPRPVARPGKPAAAAPSKAAPAKGAPASPAAGKVQLAGPWQKSYRFTAGQTVEVSVHLDRPSALPENGRVGVEWTLERSDDAAAVVTGAKVEGRTEDAPQPTANWRKVLHALDGDVALFYRAPVSGSYSLKLTPITDEAHPGDGPRWREKGVAPAMFPLPTKTPWPERTVAPITVAVNPVDLGTEEQVQKLGTMIETEPNDAPEQAQLLALVPNEEVRTYEITGGADDVEFFDNGKVGRSGDDWFRVELKGSEPRLVTAQLSIPGQVLAGRIRTYKLADGAGPTTPLGGVLPVSEWLGTVNPDREYFNEDKPVVVEEGRDPNERVHQQEELHRANITRLLQPGKSYYFRVEANAPGYQFQLRVLRPAPYTDARMAVRQGMYTQIGQVDAWLTNRPRGASVERRIRDTGNLLGTQCMSCHTQSGVWGPAVPLANGYRLENVQNYWRLLNVMYECLRPTNELKDAANNTSLAPLDIGDGPAGTRAAGFAVVNGEKILSPRKLHSKQQIRTANYVLLTNDPGGINAAGKGSNVGQNIVWLFAGEILNTAWKKTGDPKYFRSLEEKARKVLVLEPKYTDDVAVRMDFFGRVFPMKDYVEQARKAADAEKAAGQPAKGEASDPVAFAEKVKAQLALDEARIRAIQNADGTWGFNPGASTDGGKTWKAAGDYDPSPTALCVTGLTSLGYGKDDPAISKGVHALLRLQEPSGRWNKAAITGFVTSAYALRALGQLYPVKPYVPQRAEFVAPPNESLLAAVKRVQALALTGKPEFADLLLPAAHHSSPLVRYWAMIGLGATHTDAGVPVLLTASGDRSKPVRDAATWALRQTLLDDRGWDAALAAYAKGDDYTREHVMQAFGIRADAVMPQARLSFDRFTQTVDRAMNDDPHPAVRAWATKAAWQWWIWNPPVRAALNQAWIRMLERPESNALVENSNRYSTQALFIANGHRANGSTEHQYKELATLFEALRARLEKAEPATKSLLAKRIVGAAATFYQTTGGDGGPGQMGYTTPGAAALMGQSVLVYLRDVEPTKDTAAILAGLEGAANIPHRPLQEFLLEYALRAPEELRKTATAAVSDPRSVSLQAATELVEPLIAQVKRGALEPARRATLSDPVVQLFGSVNWIIPKDAEQQRHFFNLIIPQFDRYVSPEQLAAMTDAAARAELEREMNAAWYLADKIGEVLAKNADLHQAIVFEQYFPTEFKNPLERHFWLRSVPWILEHKHALPDVAPAAAPAGTGAALLQAPAAGQAAPPVKIDPGAVIKDRAIQLYLDALRPDAPAETRAAAVRISNQTAVRRNPEVLAALVNLLKVEKDEQLRKIAENVVKQGSARFVPDLVAALQGEKKPNNGLLPDGTVNPVLLEDVTYFRDYVIPELARAKRSDQAACLGCHGIPARVPSFFLKPVDNFGYISVPDLLFNYREMQARVNMKDLANSKILRKPLNVQDGKEDGHQGGRRYLPGDEGYLILKNWVENQPAVQAAVMGGGAASAEADTQLASALRPRALRPREPGH